MPKLTEKQKQQLAIITQGLDVTTDFGIESSSRERLLVVVGQIVGVLRVLRDTL